MTFPFVSRVAYELACAQVQYFREKAEQWEARYVEAVTPKPAAQLPERKADPVILAISEAAGSNSALRGHLSHFARTERAKGTPDDKILAQIAAYANPEAVTRSTDTADRENADAVLAGILDGV